MTSNGTTTLDDSIYDRLLRERIVVLGQEVDDPVATKLIAQLLLLAAEDATADITLYINSPGGSVFAGMAIYDTMHAIEPDVSTIATGMAASMGQFLLTAGAPGKRFALPHARVMMHQPSGGASGSESDIVIRARMLSKLKNRIAELTAQHSGQQVQRIAADSDRDRWFTARDAVDYGLIDQVLRGGTPTPTV
jgi:ATP-dependent Clp protease, protease subunit